MIKVIIRLYLLQKCNFKIILVLKELIAMFLATLNIQCAYFYYESHAVPSLQMM